MQASPQSPVIYMEKGIPIPERTKIGPPRKRHYPFDKLEVGDSFSIDLPKDQKEVKRLRSTLTSSANFWVSKNPGFKVVTRTDKEANRLRVWKLASDGAQSQAQG